MLRNRSLREARFLAGSAVCSAWARRVTFEASALGSEDVDPALCTPPLAILQPLLLVLGELVRRRETDAHACRPTGTAFKALCLLRVAVRAASWARPISITLLVLAAARPGTAGPRMCRRL
jgi:hypothetical protein